MGKVFSGLGKSTGEGLHGPAGCVLFETIHLSLVHPEIDDCTLILARMRLLNKNNKVLGISLEQMSDRATYFSQNKIRFKRSIEIKNKRQIDHIYKRQK